MWHYVGGPPSRRSLCWQGSWWRVIQRGSWQRTVEETSRVRDSPGAVRKTDKMSSQSGVDNGQQKEAVMEGQSGWVGIPSSFVEISLEILLYFDPSPRHKNVIPRWYTGRKWHIPTASNRKRSCGRIKAYDMGQGEGLIVPLQSCTGRE